MWNYEAGVHSPLRSPQDLTDKYPRPTNAGLSWVVLPLFFLPPSSPPPNISHYGPRYLAMSRDLRETSTWKDISEAMQVRASTVF